MVQDTSRHAYTYSVLPNLGERQREVYDYLLENGPLTNLEIADSLNLPINSVTPRTNELVHMGLVHLYERRKCMVSGRTAMAWEARRDTLF